MHTTYLEIIKFCSLLSIRQLIAYRDAYKQFKNKEYLVACEVLRIRLNEKK